MDSYFDPLFAHEQRLGQLSIRRSKLKSILMRIRPTASDLGVLVSLVLVGIGVRQRRAVRAAAAVSQETLKAALGNAKDVFSRISSREGLASMVGFTPPSTPRQISPSPSAECVHPQAGSTSDPLRIPDFLHHNLVVRFANFFRRHFDRTLLGFLAFKLALLVLYTMPVSYFFGAKRAFLQWASRAPLFRLYIRSLPFTSLGLVAAGFLVERFTSQPVRHETAQRWQALSFLNTVLSYCTVRLFELVRGDPTPVIQVEETAEDRDLLAISSPPSACLRAATAIQRQLTPPHVMGLENLPKERRRLLIVGNHNIWGLDSLVLVQTLHEHAGIWARPLGEHSWFVLPGVAGAMKFIGAVDGTRHNCELLMNHGENILVYPGGARESWKRTTDPRYALIWGDHHLGFVTMAVRHGYTMVPVASVGMEDVVRPVYDLPLQRILTLGGLLKAGRGKSKAFDADAKLPLLGVNILNAQRGYFKIMPAITTSEYSGRVEDVELLRRLRDETKARLQQGIEEVFRYRESDPHRYVFGKPSEGSKSHQQPPIKVPPMYSRM